MAATPIRALLARGELADVVPLGIVLHLLTGDAHGAPRHPAASPHPAASRQLSASPHPDPQATHHAQLALVRLEPRWGDTAPGPASLTALGQATHALLSDLVHDRRADADVRRALDRAEVILAQVQAGPLALYSELLASGLQARFVVLAEALRRAVGPQRTPDATQTVDAAWAAGRERNLGSMLTEVTGD